MTRRVRHSIIGFVAVTLLVTSCSASEQPSSVRLGGSRNATTTAPNPAGNPVVLAPLAGSAATGPAHPDPMGAVLTPDSHLSSSVAPTLTIPGATGAWTFTVDDAAGNSGSFGPLVFDEAEPRSAIPKNAGLEPGRLYTWTAQQVGQPTVTGSFTVDTQLFDVQHLDRAGGVDVAMASGEATFVWSSHGLKALAGEVGFTLRHAASSPSTRGLPPGWTLHAATSSPFEGIDFHSDGTITLRGGNGLVIHYRPEADGRYTAVDVSGGPFSSAGSAPVVAATPDGEWLVAITKEIVTVFRRPVGASSARPAAVGSSNQPMLRQEWVGDRLRSVIDPVSQRRLEFLYGGDTCPTPPDGFVDAPSGMMCGARFWDDSTVAIFYVTAPDGTPRPGRIVDRPEAEAGANVTDVAYDASGRVVRLRSPLVAATAAAGLIDPNDEQFTTAVGYDDMGRVAEITLTAPTPGATRCQRSYRYPTPSVSEVYDSCFGGIVTSLESDPTTLVPLAITYADGRSRRFEWDGATLQPQRRIEVDGTITEFEHRADGSSTVRGPSRGSLSQAPVVERRHDEVRAADGTLQPLVGLDMTAWSWEQTLVNPVTSMIGPVVNGILAPSLTVNWNDSPLGVPGPWTAVLTGDLVVDTPGVYRFASNTSNALLRVAGVLCQDGRCDALVLGSGSHAIRIDVDAASDAASMDVVWAGPDTDGAEQAIPTARLRPGYGRVTSTVVTDPLAPPGAVSATSVSEFADPAQGRLTARVNQAGLRTTLTYEPPGSGWGRQLGTTLPGGNSVTFTHWGDTQVATAPCPGALPVSQAGTVRHIITPGPNNTAGPTSQQWVDAAGRVHARQLGEGAITCRSYDAAGRLNTTELLGMGITTREDIRYHVGGDPRVTEWVHTLGSDVLVRRQSVDLTGRPVQLTDEFGTRLDVAYDERTGEVASITTTAPGLGTTITTQTFDAAGGLGTVTHDGVEMARVAYDADTVTSVRFGNGVTVKAAYDDIVRMVGLTWTTATGEELSHREQVTLAGFVESETFSVGSASSTFRYTHDTAGRLEGIALSSGVAARAQQWRYTYDDNSNRTSTTVDGRTTTLRYDTADRLVATDAASAQGGIVYDARGNMTVLGATTFQYDAADRLVEVVDGNTTITLRRDANGSIVATTVSSPNGTSTTSSGLGGTVLDGTGQVIAQRLELPGGAIVERQVAEPSASTWTFSDLDGNAWFTTDANGGRLGDVALSTPFGEPLATSVNTPSTGGWRTAHEVITLATSRPLVVMGARLYLPEFGRFAQLDPVVGGSANGYDYASQNPVHLDDPTGEAFLDWLPGIFVLGATVASMALIPPATSLLVGAVVGGLVTAGIKLGQYALTRLAGHPSPFTFAQAAEQIALSIAFGGWGGYTGYTKTAAAVKFPIANKAWLLSMLVHDGPRVTPPPVQTVGTNVVASSGNGLPGAFDPAVVESVTRSHHLRSSIQSGSASQPIRRLLFPVVTSR
jgi:RHS repeat-associated protein